jgi:hypothetical protein
LRGRDESDCLEFKSSESSLNTASERVKAAEEVAGMVSAAGGFLVFGSDDGDHLAHFSGHGVQDLDALGRSLRDHVRPRPVAYGPREFSDEDGRTIAVVQVLPDPLGRPVSVRGRFLVRVGTSSVPMAPEDVARRHVAVALGRERAAEEAIGWVARLLPTGVKSYMGVAIAPHAKADLGLSGRSLLADVLRPAIELETQTAADTAGSSGSLLLASDSFRVSSDGVGYTTLTGDLRTGAGLNFSLTHQGQVTAVLDLGLHAGEGADGGKVHLREFELVALRVLGVVVAVYRMAAMPAPVVVAMHAQVRGPLAVEEASASGRVTRWGTMSRPNADFGFDLQPWGPADPFYESVRLFAQRLYENTQDEPHTVIAEWEGHRAYAETLFRHLANRSLITN